MRTVTIRRESWPIRGTFRISRGAKTAADVIVVEICDGDSLGRGECVPYARYGESLDSVEAEIAAIVPDLEDGLDRLSLQSRMKAGAARNAVDCALWDLEAKISGIPVWKTLGLPVAPKPVVTAYTISLDTPENMGLAAAKNADRPLMKLKLTGEGDLERVCAVRENAPATRIVVDANEGWTADMVEPYSLSLKEYGVEMIEQPLPADKDDDLALVRRPIPICADESAHTRTELGMLTGKYDMINIKLDKTGGLTEAMALRDAAEVAGLSIMVGCMLATSLAMAPAVYLGQGAAVVDLDGPLLLEKDRDGGLEFQGSTILPPRPELWG